MDQAVLWVAAAGALAGAGLALFRRSRAGDAAPGARRPPDALAVLGLKAEEALARIAPPPIDLTRPITTEADWQVLRDHARDPAYRAALDQLRARYRFSAPMLLPNTLRTAMEARGIGFREAVIAAARDDTLR